MAEGEFSFGVYIPSYKRAMRGVVTGKLFEHPSYVVRKSQQKMYEDAGFPNVIGVDDTEIDSYEHTFNWIVDNATEDVIAIVDDDVKSFMYRLDYNYVIEDVETCQAEFERLAQLIHDLDIGLAFGSATAVPYDYTSEFGWLGIPGAFKIVNRKMIKARMASMPRNVDIDYVLQELLKNRICLNAKYLVDVPYKDKNTNNSGSNYDAAAIESSVQIMKTKWGKYFSYNFKKNVPHVNVQR